MVDFAVFFAIRLLVPTKLNTGFGDMTSIVLFIERLHRPKRIGSQFKFGRK